MGEAPGTHLPERDEAPVGLLLTRAFGVGTRGLEPGTSTVSWTWHSATKRTVTGRFRQQPRAREETNLPGLCADLSVRVRDCERGSSVRSPIGGAVPEWLWDRRTGAVVIGILSGS